MKNNLNDIALIKCKLRADIFNIDMAIKVFEGVICKLLKRLEIYVPSIFRSASFVMSTPSKVELKISHEGFGIGGIMSTTDSVTDMVQKLDTVYNNHVLLLRFFKLKYRCFHGHW